MWTLPGKRGWQSLSQAVCTPPWPPWSPSCHCTLCPTPESHSSLPAPPHGPHRDYGHQLTEAEDRDRQMRPPGLYIIFMCLCTIERSTHSFVEAHGRNVTPDWCVFLMAAAQGVTVEVALSQWLFKPRALHLVHVDRPNPYRESHQTCMYVILLNLWLNLLWLQIRQTGGALTSWIFQTMILE